MIQRKGDTTAVSWMQWNESVRNNVPAGGKPCSNHRNVWKHRSFEGLPVSQHGRDRECMCPYRMIRGGPPNCVILGKLPNDSGPLFPHRMFEIIFNTYFAAFPPQIEKKSEGRQGTKRTWSNQMRRSELILNVTEGKRWILNRKFFWVFQNHSNGSVQ